MNLFKQFSMFTQSNTRTTDNTSILAVFNPQTKEVRELQELVANFASLQYKNKELAASMLKLISEHANRLAESEITFDIDKMFNKSVTAEEIENAFRK